ncbi:flagellar biosynthesis protein FlhF [Halobacillus litoralis]|uniref:Flagellar biosynthesis protein FlhF n=1 Tax=Halobacillus litoralis TaxID=45668 RepID=A0A845EBP3_9BACI|nr:flagellar biosynthesis protein FlhF [Halobacillus litoralis]MYL48678.1 flagellar biosynthesis protein FlhF [Halobacillus litoralis]
MRVKKFEAATMPEVMKKVRSELGADAVILNSKVKKSGGFLGLFKKDITEVIAAIDPSDEHPSTFGTARAVEEKEGQAPTVNPNHEIMEELKHLRSLIQNRKEVYPENLEIAYEFLLNQEVSEDVAGKTIERLIEKGGSFDDLSEIENLLRLELYESMKQKRFGKPAFDKKFIHLVGPTGVGKTTTLAKLAAEAALNHQLDVGFITTDTYRIAAIDQLKTYAKILDIPLEVAYSMEDYKRAKERFQDFDLVLVDTAGRNFRNPSFIRELHKMIDFDEESDNFLVLGLTSKFTDMSDIFEQFKDIPIHQLILTKADETARKGNAVNMVLTHDVGVAYLTDGQNVPDDIQTASAMGLASEVMEGFSNERSS